MITLTIVEQKKVKGLLKYERSIKVFKSIDKARQFIKPIVKEMQIAKKEKREPKIKIDAVSYDTPSEKQLLLELHAVESIDNESAF